MDFRTYSSYPALLLFAFLTAVYGISGNAYASDMEEINSLEQQFHTVTNEIYSNLANNMQSCQHSINSLKKLNLQLKSLKKHGKDIDGLCLINKNISFIRKNIDSSEIFYVFQYLLENNDYILANSLYSTAKAEGDKSLISNISYQYARYYAKRKEWKKVKQATNDIFNDLAFEDANYARLIAGIALQNLKAHRKAVKLYIKIPEKSRYYPASQLNIATAYLRQDWWTDAQLKINGLLKNKKIHLSKEMVNRLYLVSGYSLLRKEYYRDAREAFRNVEIKSIYSNRALLGIALTATSQEDFISALNAINILKHRKIHDLTVDESYLLLPYIYEKLKQNMTASASYTDALNFYKTKINILKQSESRPVSSENTDKIISNNYKLIVDDTSINFLDDYPSSFLDNSKILSEIAEHLSQVKSNSIKHKFNLLKKRYNNLLAEMVKNLVTKYSGHLNNYMNQSRFGVARLYDSTRNTDE